MKAAVARIAGLGVLLALLVVGCAQLGVQAQTGAASGSARRVTILYTGYGRGVLDPQATDCT